GRPMQKNPKRSPRVLVLIRFFGTSSSVTCTADALFANSQLTNHFSITIHIVCSEVIEQPAPFSYNLEKASAGRVIFLVRFKMLGQISNAFAQYRDLDFRGTRIRRVNRVLRDDGAFR